MAEKGEITVPVRWKTGQNPDAVISEIKIILGNWGRRASYLESLLAILGTAAIVSSLSISAFADSAFIISHPLVIKLLGFLSALCLTIITAFNLASKANSVRKAWRHLNKAFYRYNSDIVDIKELVKAYDEGEEMIGSTVDFSYAKK